MTPYYEDDLVTLYHGDCREITAWLEADVLVTDPPYGMALKSGRGGAFGQSTIAGDLTTESRDAVLGAWGDRPALVFGRWSEPRPTAARMVLIWEKGEHVGMGDLSLPWKPNTEEIYVLGSGFVGHRGGSVIRCLAIAGTVGQAGKGTRHHPTEKPVSLMAELIRKTQGVVADPFAGSGTTLRAAKDEGRRAIGVELDERYCEIAAKRLAQDTLFGGVA
jgi:site-specific DNA-methyltransferase (adenine-specific)